MKNPLLHLGRIAVLAAALAGAACHSKIEPGGVEKPAGIPLPPDAETLSASAETVSTRVDVVGTASSEKVVTLSARISANVQEVRVAAGDRVSAGQTLIALDDREIREQLAAADAQLKQAETEFKRAQQLIEKGATTEQALTAAESAFDTARAQSERARVMLSYTEVKAPLSGIVTERQVDAGDLASPGQPLLTLFDPEHMRLEAPVPVRLIEKLALGQRVEVALDYPARKVPGEVTEIVSEIDPLSRTRKVKVRLENAQDVLPGAFGRLWVEGSPREAVLVPASAVRRSGQLEMLMIVRDGRVMSRSVRTGQRFGDRVEVLSGVQAGEQILLGGG
jgi:RND family efflux transporter MFP subunit